MVTRHGRSACKKDSYSFKLIGVGKDHHGLETVTLPAPVIIHDTNATSHPPSPPSPSNNNSNNNDGHLPRCNTTKARCRIIRSTRNGIHLNNNQRQNIYNSIKKQRNTLAEKDSVVNMSDRKLSLTDSTIPNQGLNFGIANIAINKIMGVFRNDVSRFIRKACITMTQNGQKKFKFN